MSKAQGNEQIPPTTSVKWSSHQGIKQCELFTMRLCQSDGHSFFWQANLTYKNEFTINTHNHTHIRESNNDIPSATHIQAIATDNQVLRHITYNIQGLKTKHSHLLGRQDIACSLMQTIN